MSHLRNENKYHGDCEADEINENNFPCPKITVVFCSVFLLKMNLIVTILVFFFHHFISTSFYLVIIVSFYLIHFLPGENVIFYLSEG